MTEEPSGSALLPAIDGMISRLSAEGSPRARRPSLRAPSPVYMPAAPAVASEPAVKEQAPALTDLAQQLSQLAYDVASLRSRQEQSERASSEAPDVSAAVITLQSQLQRLAVQQGELSRRMDALEAAVREGTGPAGAAVQQLSRQVRAMEKSFMACLPGQSVQELEQRLMDATAGCAEARRQNELLLARQAAWWKRYEAEAAAHKERMEALQDQGQSTTRQLDELKEQHKTLSLLWERQHSSSGSLREQRLSTHNAASLRVMQAELSAVKRRLAHLARSFTLHVSSSAPEHASLLPLPASSPLAVAGGGSARGTPSPPAPTSPRFAHFMSQAIAAAAAAAAASAGSGSPGGAMGAGLGSGGGDAAAALLARATSPSAGDDAESVDAMALLEDDSLAADNAELLRQLAAIL